MGTPTLDISGSSPALQASVRAGQEADRRGRPSKARGHFEVALAHLTRGDAHLAASLLRWIAWTFTNGGDSDAALDTLEVAEAVAIAAEDNRGLASVLNTRAGTFFSLGDLDQAKALFHRVRRLAVQTGDLKLCAMVDQNLGSVASVRGDRQEALDRFESSLRSYQNLGEHDYVGPLLNNMGRLLTEMGEGQRAERALLHARQHCLGRGDRHHHIVIELSRARLRLKFGRPTDALVSCREAARLSEAEGDPRWRAEIRLLSGAAYARLQRPDKALVLLAHAAQIARQRRDAKTLADIVMEQAAVLRSVGRNRETLECLNEAHRLFDHLRARRDLHDVDSRVAELEASFLRIVTEWGESIESKDPYTRGHCSRVARYACALAVAKGLPESVRTWFRMGALLHDVGKVAVPIEILNKEGILDAEEMRVMETHPVVGVELLEGVEFPWDVRPMIRHHHERWNGSGYPDGLAGAAIPLAARILTVADIYDALTTDRSYRPGFTHAKALEIMKSEAGETLDPELFQLFVRHVADEGAVRSQPHLRSEQRGRRYALAPPAVQRNRSAARKMT